MVEIFTGNEISEDKIAILKNIAYQRYSKEIYDEYFADIHDIKGLSRLHCVSVEMERLALGTDWFLCYSDSNNFVHILEWVSTDNGNVIIQTAEMMRAFKKIFLRNEEKFFVADMRHDTSYIMYLNMLDRGLFQEFRHEYMIDCAAPIEVFDMRDELIDKYCNIENFLESDDSENYYEYFKFILHHISFMLTNKFIEKYSKEATPIENQILKKKKN